MGCDQRDSALRASAAQVLAPFSEWALKAVLPHTLCMKVAPPRHHLRYQRGFSVADFPAIKHAFASFKPIQNFFDACFLYEYFDLEYSTL